ncbi:MAG: SurA N-terminal domain-containing protein [Candidatus Omnitrophica bacterium]|nr:SurA N-terminal domain-containing protein [Candidatus Omnitrophota bacterium]MCF7894066.1 SurA N-terminal domain-containing protein [Candidatus Omnitrophota bacterium]
MFIRLTDKHKKLILWAMVVIIVPAFVLWGSSAMRGNKENIIGKIKEKPITRDDFLPYLELAQIYFLMNADKEQTINTEDIYSLAANFYLLLYQADKESVKVSDQEVIDHIQKIPYFSPDNEFMPSKYQQFIKYLGRQMNRRFLARNFEEYVRSVLKREKLFNKHVTIKVTDQEVKKAYKIKIQEAKIAYLLIPYDLLEIDANVPSSTLKDFYQENKSLFRREKKIKVKYISLDPGSKEIENTITYLEAGNNLDDLKELDVEETDFFGVNQPIADIGFAPQINQPLFNLEKGETSPPFKIKEQVFVFQKIDEQEASVPAFSQIQDEVKKVYLKDQAESLAEKMAENIIKEVKATGNNKLKGYAKRKEIEYTKTEPFKYLNYIPGFGLSKKISDLVFFDLEEGQLYSKPLVRKNGVYVVKLLEKTDIDPDKFKAEKENYYQDLKANKEIEKRVEYLNNLRNKLSFQLEVPQ